MNAVPVLMYHSVGRPIAGWRWPELTVPFETFADHLVWLRRAGYHSATLGDLHRHKSGEQTLPPKTVVLTFDDGYVDNWTYVAPLLEMHGFTGTVLVTPEFVDPRDVVRPTFHDVVERRVPADELELDAFMSWTELARAAESGVLDIQSHALTHTWYPTGPNVVDFHHPGDGHYWLDWNAHPEDKPGYLKMFGTSKVAWGTPVYEHEKSLKSPRFFPDPRESEEFTAYVADNGGESFFEDAGWREALDGRLRSFRKQHGENGRPETPAERTARIDLELCESKRQIEVRLGRPVEHLVWPGGGYDDEAMAMARDVYRSVTVSSSDRWRLKNAPGEDPGVIVRRGVPSLRLNGRDCHPGGRYLVEFLDEFCGSVLARRRRQIMKVGYIALGKFGQWPKAA